MATKTKEKKQDVETVTISYADAINALCTINPRIEHNGQHVPTSSPLSKAKGKVALQVYFLKHELQKVFAPYDEIMKSIGEQARELAKEEKELKEEEKSAIGKRKEEIAKRLNAINDELNELADERREKNKQTETVALKKGKIKFSEVENCLSSDDIVFLEFALDLEQ